MIVKTLCAILLVIVIAVSFYAVSAKFEMSQLPNSTYFLRFNKITGSTFYMNIADEQNRKWARIKEGKSNP